MQNQTCWHNGTTNIGGVREARALCFPMSSRVFHRFLFFLYIFYNITRAPAPPEKTRASKREVCLTGVLASPGKTAKSCFSVFRFQIARCTDKSSTLHTRRITSLGYVTRALDFNFVRFGPFVFYFADEI